MDWGTVVLSLFCAALGGLIGTYWGAKRISSDEENKKQKVRDIALKSLNVINNYAKGKNKYTAATENFNNALNLAEKRAVIVALHKVGLPIAMPSAGIFAVKKVTFLDEEIIKDEVDDMIAQVKSGNCDHLFFADIDTYFNENLRIKTMRNIAKKYVNDVLSKTSFNKDSGVQTPPKDWHVQFTKGEFNIVIVFSRKTIDDSYYDIEGKPEPQKLATLINEIETGLWDKYLYLDIIEYNNLYAQMDLASTAADSIRGQHQRSCANFVAREQEGSATRSSNTAGN